MITYRSIVLSALEETEDALVSYSEEQARREHLEPAVKSNLESVQLSSERYKAGLTDFHQIFFWFPFFSPKTLILVENTTQSGLRSTAGAERFTALLP